MLCMLKTSKMTVSSVKSPTLKAQQQLCNHLRDYNQLQNGSQTLS